VIICIGPRRAQVFINKITPELGYPHMVGRTYTWLYRTPVLPAATYLFWMIDRLDPAERRLAASFYRYINAQGDGYRALNDPAKGVGRFRLLRRLHEAGINDFNAYLVSEDRRPARFPVFIRNNTRSLKPLTPLLETQGELDRAVEALIAEGEPAEDLLIIELCSEPLKPGVHVRYSTFRIGDQVFPCYNIYEDNWYANWGTANLVDEAEHRREQAMLADSPYNDTLRRAFELADIEYGRADFGVVGGRPQIYEINFNPRLIPSDGKEFEPHPIRQENRWSVFRRRAEALHAIDGRGTGSVRTLTTDELRQFRLRFWRNYAPQRY
jgi:hypothetical protein